MDLNCLRIDRDRVAGRGTIRDGRTTGRIGTRCVALHLTKAQVERDEDAGENQRRKNDQIGNRHRSVEFKASVVNRQP
jgi:hypothetical protein